MLIIHEKKYYNNTKIEENISENFKNEWKQSKKKKSQHYANDNVQISFEVNQTINLSFFETLERC